MLPNLFALLLANMSLILMTGALAQQVDKVIMVDDYAVDDGSAHDNGSGLPQFACVQYTSMIYTCPSFETALEILENNTIINITTNMVLLQSIVHLTQLNNIAIVGLNMTTVECNDTGVLNCSLCSNVSIRGITWNKCGTFMEIYNDGLGLLSTYSYPGVIFSKCSNIFIQHCVFQNSMSSAVHLSEIFGVVNIDDIKFVFNGKRKLTKGVVENAATGLAISQPAIIKEPTGLNISITRCTFSHNNIRLDKHGYSGVLLIHSNSISTNLTFYLSECEFISNGIFGHPKSIVTDTPVSVVGINILQYLDVASILFSEVTFESNRMLLSDHSSILELYITPKQIAQVNIQITSCDFINNTAFDVAIFQKQLTLDVLSNVTVTHDQGSNDAKKFSPGVSFNKTGTYNTAVINGSIFRQNVAGRSVLHLKSNYNDDIYNDQFTITNSTFEDNSETVIYVMGQHVTFKEMIQFTDNIAEYGAAMYLGMGSTISFDEDCDVTFANNFARSYGGAIFYDATQLSSTCEDTYMPIQVHNDSVVSFTSNGAGIAGNSIYLSTSQSCNISFVLDVVSGFNFSETNGHLVTSPRKLVLYSPAKKTSSTNSLTSYRVNNIMLGQVVTIPTCVLDYQNNSAGKVLFQVTRVNLNQNYSVIAPNFMSLDCESFRVSDIQVIGNPVGEGDNISVTIQFTSSYNSALNWTQINVNLIIELSPCRPGFFYNDHMQQCVCYRRNNIISCLNDKATIMKGYWFGMVNNKHTVSKTRCIQYCDYKNCETNRGVCTLPSSLDEQCMPHRTGPACSKCVEGYTLPFDSVHCVKSSDCTVGMTILVVLITLIYWAAITIGVFGIMHFQTSIGYLYAITYFYSMLDVFLEENLHPFKHDFLYRLVAVLSGVAKLTPRFIGEFCFTEGLSGIDQQFMHYIHPIAIWLVIAVITMLARFSPRLSAFLGRGIIRAICLLILLSFTAASSSTTLMITTTFRFTSTNVWYVLASPDMIFHKGRHLYYSIVAYIFIILSLVLPLVLLTEPFLNRGINFTKIKPLLDQFQGCYKDRLRWFASYYMMCRGMILNLVVSGYQYYMPLNWLLVTCTVINLIHWLVRPYANKVLNIYDGLVLQTFTMIIVLRIIYSDNFDSLVPIAATIALVILPIIMLAIMAVYLNAEQVKNFFRLCFVTLKVMRKKKAHRQTAISRKEYDVTVDNELRKQSTTVVGVHELKQDTDNTDRVSFQESLLEVMIDTM